MNVNRREYTGKVQAKPGERDAQGQILYPYLPSPHLVEAVNLAIYLERPLLIKGEPGCGKTRLARAVAYELGLPYEAWHIKSTSRARDGLYIYDAIGRLRDAQLVAAGSIRKEDLPPTYVQMGPMGRAFQDTEQTVILIDEIDKADIDFPNDLLLELDEQRFFIEETGEPIQAIKAPIVFITSNDEKDLPDAFLRRCLFHYVEFPKPEQLMEIVNAHFQTSPKEADLVSATVKRFTELRQQMYDNSGDTGKKVSTSELIDWFRVLRRDPMEALKQLDGKLPYPSVLLKSWEDYRQYPDRLHTSEH